MPPEPLTRTPPSPTVEFSSRRDDLIARNSASSPASRRMMSAWLTAASPSAIVHLQKNLNDGPGLHVQGPADGAVHFGHAERVPVARQLKADVVAQPPVESQAREGIPARLYRPDLGPVATKDRKSVVSGKRVDLG